MTRISKSPERTIKTLYVKYMVCRRDKVLVNTELDQLGVRYRLSAHGAILFLEEITNSQQNRLKNNLLKSGLVLLDEGESRVVDRIIYTIIEIIHSSDKLPKLSFKDIISDHSEFASESVLKIFSEVQGMSVMQFIVTQKIERAKELLLYEDQSLSEMSDILNYKNESLLVAQFKKYTGLTPGYFKKLKSERKKLSGSKSSGLEKSMSNGA